MTRTRTLLLGPIWSGVALGVVAVVALASCLLTTDFTGVAGQNRPPDAAASTDGAIPPDPADAGSDADGSTPPLEPTANCQGPHSACADFDDGALTARGWQVMTTDGGAVRLDPDQFVSPPASFHSTIAPTNDQALVTAVLSQTVHTGPITTVIYAFDMRITACAGKNSSITVAYLQPSPEAVFGLPKRSVGTWTFAQQLTKDTTFIPGDLPDLPTGKWFRMSFRLTLGSTSSHEVVKIDGETVLDAEIVPVAPSENTLLNIGANANGPLLGCEVAFDNVTYDKE